MAAPNDLQVDIDDATVRSVETAFAFASGGNSYTRSTTRGIVGRNVTDLAKGPGAAAAIASKDRWFAGLRQYNASHPLAAATVSAAAGAANEER